jgi:putative addiction module component (TIGR02574 family)
MRSKVDRLLAESLTLPKATRARLAGHLLDSLDGDLAEPAAGTAWEAEIERRVLELDNGARTSSWAEVRAQILKSRRRETKRAQVSRRSAS